MGRIAAGIFLVAVCGYGATLNIVGGNELRVPAGGNRVAGWLVLQNSSKDAVSGTLRARFRDSLVSSQPGRVLLFAKSETEKGAPEFKIDKAPPGGSIYVWMDASGLAEPGLSQPQLFLDDEPVGPVQIRKPEPFAVNLDPQDSQIRIADGEGGRMALVNDDPFAYKFKWQIALDGITYAGDGEIREKGTAIVRIPWKKDASSFGAWGWLYGLLKDDTRQAIVTLTDSSTGVVREYKAFAVLQYWPNIGGLTSNLILILTLAAGASVSLFAKLWLPNARKKAELLESLAQLNGAINGISENLGARPIVLLRAQQDRLRDALDPHRPGGRWAFSPDFAEAARNCEAGVARLDRQVKLIASLTRSISRLEACAETFPPSQVELNTLEIDETVEIGVRPGISEQSLAATEATAQRIAERVQNLDNGNTDFRPQVQQRLNDVTRFFTPLLQPVPPQGPVQPVPTLAATVARIRKDVPAPFEILTLANIPEDVSFEVLAEYDADLFKLSLIRRYVVLNPDLTLANPQPKTIEALYPDLVRCLRLRSWDSIRNARTLVCIAEEGIYPEDVEQALTSKEFDICADRPVKEPGVYDFSIVPRRDDLNGAAAVGAYKGVWSFSFTRPKAEPEIEVLPHRCCRPSRYFAEPGTYTVTLKFERNGKPVADPQTGKQLEHSSDDFVVRTRSYPSPMLRFELLTMVLALTPALFAVLATARQQLEHFEWYAALGTVFAIGFGIDVLKTYLSGR